MDSHTKKLTIYRYADKRLEQTVGEFVLPINPEQYEQSFKIEQDDEPAQGAQGVEGRYKSSGPEEMSLDFVLDGTDTAYGYALAGRSVQTQLQSLKKTVYDLDGEIHQPPYLKLLWKDLAFYCTLSEMKVTYTLFDAEGSPIRAKVNCTFVQYKETERRVREEGKSSPDLTHTRLIKDQENLPLLTHKIYGSPDYYLEVALANDLTNFRSISAGTTLAFYPLDKTGT